MKKRVYQEVVDDGGAGGSGLSPSPAKTAGGGGGCAGGRSQHQLLQQRLHHQQYLLHQRQRGRIPDPGTPGVGVGGSGGSGGSMLPPAPPPSPVTPDTGSVVEGGGASTVIIHRTGAAPGDGEEGMETVVVHSPVAAAAAAAPVPTPVTAPTPAIRPAHVSLEPAIPSRPTSPTRPTIPAPIPATPSPATPATPASAGRYTVRISAMLSSSPQREHRQGVLGLLQLQERPRRGMRVAGLKAVSKARENILPGMNE